VISEFETGDV